MTIKITGTNTAAAPGITGDDTDTGLVYGTNKVDISTGGTSRVSVGSNGEILTGGATSEPVYPTHVTGRKVQAEIKGAIDVGNTRHHGSLALNCTNENAALHLVRSEADNTAGKDTGVIGFTVFDGTDFHQCARIMATRDATGGNNDTPGRLTFHTTADGAASCTERMRIDSSGNVTKPNSSKFSTTLTYVNEYKNAGTVIACASPHVDDNNDFDATNDRFVAPVDGAYYFTFHSNTDMNTGGRSEFHYVFRKNGSSVDGSLGGRAYGEWTGNGWEHIHMSIMMNLSASDYVDVINGRNNMRVDGGGYGQFTGFLVG